MEVDVSESQASRFAVMQYMAMLRRIPEGSLVERFNNNDAIVVGGVGRVPFPNADAFVQGGKLSFAFGGAAPSSPTQQGGPSTTMPSSPTIKASPKLGRDGAPLPTVVPVESKLTIPTLEGLLKSIGSTTTDCVTTNDYAVKLYQVLDRQFDLRAEISGAVAKVRRPFGVPLSNKEETTVRSKIRSKLQSLDGATGKSSDTNSDDSARMIQKLEDRIRDMSLTIDRLRKVKGDLEKLHVKSKAARDGVTQLKQTVRFQSLDMQDFLMDQTHRLKNLVGADALRAASSASGGTLNAAKKAALESQIKAMKEQDPLRDAVSVLKLMTDSVTEELQRILRAPMDPAQPVDVSSDDDDGAEAKRGSNKRSGEKEKPKRRKLNCALQLIRAENRLPKGDLHSPGWETLKGFDRAGPELDALKKLTQTTRLAHQMQKLMSQWFLENGSTQNLLNGLRREVEGLQEQLRAKTNEAVELQEQLAGFTGKPKGGSGAAGTSTTKKEATPAAAPKATTQGGNKPSTPAAQLKSTPKIAAAPPPVPPPVSPPIKAAVQPQATSSVTETAGVIEAIPAIPGPTPLLLHLPDPAPAATVSPPGSGAIEAAHSEGVLLQAAIERQEALNGQRPDTVDSVASERNHVLLAETMRSSGNAASSANPISSSIDKIAGPIQATTAGSTVVKGQQEKKMSKPKSSAKRGSTSVSAISKSKPLDDASSAPLSDVRSTGSATPREALTDACPPLSLEDRDNDPPLAVDDTKRALVRSIFLEVASLGIPSRLLRLLEEIASLVLPGDSILVTLREAVLRDEDEIVAQLVHRHVLELPSSTIGTPALAAQQETANEAALANTTEGKQRSQSTSRAVTTIVDSQQEATAGAPGSASGTSQEIPRRHSVAPQMQRHATSSSLTTSTPAVASALVKGATSPSSQPVSAAALDTDGSVEKLRGGLLDGKNTTPLQRPSVSSLPVSSVASPPLPSSAAASPSQATLLGANPLTQIRNLRKQFLTATNFKPVAAADEIDVTTLSEDDGNFARRKQKFVEMTRKLLSDLPVMKRVPPLHPLFQQPQVSPAANGTSPQIVFTAASQFPQRSGTGAR